MTALLVACSVRAALIAGGTAVVLWAMRIKSPATRHAAWTAVVAAMLLLPIWSSIGPKLSLRVLRMTPAPVAIVATPAEAVPNVSSQADAASPDLPAGSEPAPLSWQDVLVGIYLAGASLLLTRLLIGAAHARRLRRSAVLRAGHATSARCATPITIGWLAPTLILPEGWQHWPSAKLDAVLTHEGEHARRRDPLVQMAALVNRAVFWFHPLAWWLERRLSTLAEEACDAVVLAAGHSPQDYSSYLLDLARSVAHEGRRVHVVGLAMPGSGLKQRMRQILADTPAPRISRVRVFCTLACCAASSGLFAAATLTPRTASQPSALAFEVASVKPNQSSDARSPSMILPGGRFTATNNTLRALILNAYGISAMPYLLTGGPGWIDSARYDVEAKAAAGVIPADAPSRVLWERTRLMLQTLLADRFKLAVRRETKEMPVYRLVVAKSGRKLRESQRDCSADATACHGFSGNPTRLTGSGVDMSDLALLLSSQSDRPVIDGTGVQGVFDVFLQWNPFAEGVAPAADVPRSPAAESREGPRPDLSSLPTLFTALEQQLGLKLESTKGSVDTYVIDHVERPNSRQ
jgi:bla regulator protein BlaR1